ncbi:hypothetical protein NDU88_005883 [Pleurodeles waltl]|uniref:Uncharacterized protein n=1 Tax=Pleurodeles waltl TaxID=8319 RepID=A0AAV7TW19_PLEWA|nr:hypothetical protein NDU88_005883 [Pleurodeles waltl]
MPLPPFAPWPSPSEPWCHIAALAPCTASGSHRYRAPPAAAGMHKTPGRLLLLPQPVCSGGAPPPSLALRPSVSA